MNDETKWLPKRIGVVSMTIDGQQCWCRYERNGFDSESWKIELPNRVIASVIRGRGTYGYEQGLFEIAFLNENLVDFVQPKEWDDQVKGYLTETEVLSLITKMMRGEIECK